jgi:hypothetical protein
MICMWITCTGLITLHAQDTTVFKKEYQNRTIDTCTDKIVHLWLGCGHPEHYLQMCDDHTLEKLQIFDRWGYLIYVSIDQFNNIELRDVNGSHLKQDIYIYRIKYKTRSGELKTSTGQFTFIP